ncbi:MAG: iron dependent repressor, metal binding and dimerization domain protein [Candidatus Krumholzibacteria bacterium]
MGSPISIIISLVFLVGAAVGLWWPGIGLLVRGTARATRERILTEDALKHIYDGEYRGHTVPITSVAGALEVSVTRAVELVDRMQAVGLVSLRDGRLLLTEEGNRYALQVIRAHRLWERYLADETGIASTEWHAKAERREHTMTPVEIDELASKLGHPRFDPHGDPIPTADGTIQEIPVLALSDLEVGDRAQVVHIEDEPEILYAQLVAMGVYVGMVVHVQAKTDKRMILDADERALVIAPLLAANISIQPLEVIEAPEHEGPERTLAELGAGEVAVVDRISPACRGIERRRLMDLGIVPGTRVVFERRGMTGGLSAYRVRGALIAIREEQAAVIYIHRINEVAQ